MNVYIVRMPYDDGPPIAAFLSRANAEAFAEEQLREAVAKAKQTDPDEVLSPAYCVKVSGVSWEETCFLHKAFVQELEVQP